MNMMAVRRRFTRVPCTKEMERMYFTFFNSSFRILLVLELSRFISCAERPRLFTNSIFLNDSVVDPASEVVSATMIFCSFFTFLLRKELTKPSTGITPK